MCRNNNLAGELHPVICRLASLLTKEEFMESETAKEDCPGEYGLLEDHPEGLGADICSMCWRNAIDDIKFKGEK